MISWSDCTVLRLQLLRCGMSLKVGGRVYVTPSGVQKENLIVDDVFTLSAVDKDVIIEPPATKNLQQSAYTPIWYGVIKHRPNARSEIHTNSINAQQLCTSLNGDEDKEIRITHYAVCNGLGFHGYEGELVVPIIENRPSVDGFVC